MIKPRWIVNIRTISPRLSHVLTIVAVLLPALASTATRNTECVEGALGSQLARIVADTHLPGAVAAVRYDDEPVIAAAAGYSDVGRRTTMTIESRMLGASEGKTFVAALALALKREGRLDLDAKISTWLGGEPWFKRLPNHDDLTLRMLLTHSSGIGDHLHEKAFQQTLGDGFARDPDFTLSPQQQIAFVLDHAPQFPAGRGYGYSDTDYLIAGLIIEQVTGRTWYSQVQERFVSPLHLIRTEPSTRRQFANLAIGYVTVDSWIPLHLRQTTLLDKDGGGGTTHEDARAGGSRRADVQRVLIFNPAFEWTGGGYLTNAQDLAMWASALYRGKAMSGEYLDELLAPYPDVPKSPYGAAGLGVGIQPTKFGPAYGHGGTMPGYASAMNYFPDLKLSIAVQANAGDFDRLGVLLDLIDALLNARCASVSQ